MSDTGLYSSIYEQLRDAADQIDRALVNLRDPIKAEHARNELAAFLGAITDTESTDPSVQFLMVILKQDYPGFSSIATLAQTLRQRVPNKAEMQQLEQLAMNIDKECTSTLARIKGRR